MAEFDEWLKTQRKEKSMIGDLARDYLSALMAHEDKNMTCEESMIYHSASEDAYLALETAQREFDKFLASRRF